MPSQNWTYRDVLTSALLLALAAPAVLGIARTFNEADARIVCASNLRHIGMAMLLYANENKGSFPRTNFDVKNPSPTWGTPYEGNPNLAALPPADADQFQADKSKALPAMNDVTAALFLVLRAQQLDPLSLICPSTGQTPFDHGGGKNTMLNWTNWPGKAALRDHLSYSFANPYPSLKAIESGWKWNHNMSAEYPLAADMNPGTAVLTKLTVQSLPVEMLPGNSPNHSRGGQNVLHGDSHVEFKINPFGGVERDNIYTFGPSGKDKPTGGDGIVGPPADANDVVLLPTAHDLGICDAQGKLDPAIDKRIQAASAAMRPPTPAEADAEIAKYLGKYVSGPANKPITLDILRDKVIIKSASETFERPMKILAVRHSHIRVHVIDVDLGMGPMNVKLEGDGIDFPLLAGPGGDGKQHWTRQ